MSDNIELEIKVSGNEPDLIQLLEEMSAAARHREWKYFNLPYRSHWGRNGTLTVQSSIQHPDDRPLTADELRRIRKLLRE